MAGETILVTDAGLSSAVCIIRSLSRAGYRVIASDSVAKSPGMVSRHASATVVYPAPDVDPQAYVHALEAAVGEHGISVIFPISDNAILPLSAERDRFQPGCKLAMAIAEALAAAADKNRTADDARTLGIPVPETVLVHTVSEALAAADGLGWPVVVKPQASNVFHGDQIDKLTVTYAGNPEELTQCMEHLAGRCAVMLQRCCHGAGVGVELLMLNGKPLLAFQHERLREFPVHGGPGALRKSVALDPKLYAYASGLLGLWNWTGLAMVEFKVGEDGPWLIEVNGRVWGSMPLPVYAGLDFPAHYIRMLLDGREPNAGDGAYREGLRARHVGNDLMWIVSVLAGVPGKRHAYLAAPPRTAALRAIAQLMNPSIRNDIQTWSDPRPGLLDLIQIAQKIRNKRKAYAQVAP